GASIAPTSSMAAAELGVNQVLSQCCQSDSTFLQKGQCFWEWATLTANKRYFVGKKVKPHALSGSEMNTSNAA
ncbi:MAG TPA: hypothetical protein VI636_15350, partial [Candidatus Angelobacter sp.]